jgi:hypothetical protein
MRLLERIANKFGYTLKRRIKHVSFTIHQSYEKPGDTHMLRCAICDGIHFSVSGGDGFTETFCKNCGHEECTREGQ